MSDVRPLILPTVDEPPQAPGWLRSGPQANVRALFSSEDEAPAPRPKTASVLPPPKAASVLPPPRPASVLPPPRPQLSLVPPRAEAAEADPTDHLDVPAGSLVPPPLPNVMEMPGSRSNPPPVSDRSPASLEAERAFAEAATDLAVARAALVSQVEGQLLDLAIEVASAIVEHEVTEHPELHVALLRAALRSLGDTTHATLRTSSKAFGVIREYLGGEQADVNGVRVELIADTSVPGLGCVLEAQHVRVDATLAERLRAVRLAFEDERRRRAGAGE